MCKIPEPIVWKKEMVTFRTILGDSELMAEVLDYAGPQIYKPGEFARLAKIQCGEYLQKVLDGEITPTKDEMLFVRLNYEK